MLNVFHHNIGSKRYTNIGKKSFEKCFFNGFNLLKNNIDFYDFFILKFNVSNDLEMGLIPTIMAHASYVCITYSFS